MTDSPDSDTEQADDAGESHVNGAHGIKVAIDDSDFKCAVQRYIADNKPDSLVEQQMKSWSFRWKREESDDGAPLSALPFEPSKILSGDLIWSGEYIRVILKSRCFWTGNKEGSLVFTCIPTAEIVPSGGSGSDDLRSKESKKNDKAKNKVHRRMVQRLKGDDYIQKILVQRENQAPISQTNDPSPIRLLCEASIIQDGPNLEERVYYSEDVAEAVRRSVFSMADSALDVLDLVLSLPLLPTPPPQFPNEVSTKTTTTTDLAGRAKLRMLEEAMHDACEQEEEDEMVDDLKISSKRSKH